MEISTLDRQASYTTEGFIILTIAYCMLVTIFPPYATHFTQLADVVLFPLPALAYDLNLNNHIA